MIRTASITPITANCSFRAAGAILQPMGVDEVALNEYLLGEGVVQNILEV